MQNTLLGTVSNLCDKVKFKDRTSIVVQSSVFVRSEVCDLNQKRLDNLLHQFFCIWTIGLYEIKRVIIDELVI